MSNKEAVIRAAHEWRAQIFRIAQYQAADYYSLPILHLMQLKEAQLHKDFLKALEAACPVSSPDVA
jgi:hypothetical protein